MSAWGAKPTVPGVTGRGRHRLVASLLVAALCAACGGGGETKTAERARATPARDAVVARARPTTTQAATTTTTMPTPTTVPPRPANGFADGVPAPRVIDRGTDYVAIARSLVEYRRWLEWHDPDPALVDRAFEQYSDLAKGETSAVLQLRSRRERIQEIDRAPLGFKVMSVLRGDVSLQLTERLARRDVVSATGRVVDHAGAAPEQYIVIMMRSYSDSPWRLSVFEHPDLPFDGQP